MSDRRHFGSFRDPAGFVFRKDGELYRQVNTMYKAQYDHLMESGLYEELTAKGLLVKHAEVSAQGLDNNAYRIIRPDIIPFVSYPYEWAFGQLKAAALATLEVQKTALDHGMILKDASAYNIQFRGSKPVFIDTLSFEIYQAGEPWVAYRQFCQHFLVPLALMSYTDVRLGLLLRTHLDGICLDLATELLPWNTWLRSGLLIHVHFHRRRLDQKPGVAQDPAAKRSMGQNAMLGLVDSLFSTVEGLRPPQGAGHWIDYYGDRPSYETLGHKDELVGAMLRKLKPDTVWDLGANTGRYAWLAADTGAQVVACDTDAACVQSLYEEAAARDSTTVLPLVMDLANPSPALGSGGTERLSFFQRGPADTVLALALIHHLAIGNNLPLVSIARMFSKMGRSAIVEFVPPDDPMVEEMMLGRDPRGVHPYSQDVFEVAFSGHFTIMDSVRVEPTRRRMYVLRNKQQPASPGCLP